uniref:AP-1 complex subunit mu-2-like n=1 Tax=Rhizophora mucronata TaxID=61149 RepID=A0A2P2JWY5_RHIMU
MDILFYAVARQLSSMMSLSINV